jgi:hypothetical protein
MSEADGVMACIGAALIALMSLAASVFLYAMFGVVF